MNSIALPAPQSHRIGLFFMAVSIAFATAWTRLSDVLPKHRPSARTFAGDLITGLVYVVTHPEAVRNALANTLVDLIDAGAGPGTLVFQTAVAAEVATLTFSDPAFGNAAAGIATANLITADSSATGGVTDRFVVQDSDTTPVFLGSVGGLGSGEDIELSSLNIAALDTVSMSSLTYGASP